MPVVVRTRKEIEEEKFRKDPPQVLTFDECARFLCVSAPTLRDLIQFDGLPCRQIGKNTRIFSTRAVIHWVEEKEDEPNKENQP